MKISTTKITIEKYSERIIQHGNGLCPRCGRENVSPFKHQAKAAEVNMPHGQPRSENNIDNAIALIAEKISRRNK